MNVLKIMVPVIHSPRMGAPTLKEAIDAVDARTV
jgi:hypothetical protein